MTSKTEVNRPPRANRSSFVEHLVQTHRVYLLMRHLTGLYSMQFEPGAISRVATVVEFVAARARISTTFNTPKFPDAESKGFPRGAPGRAPGPEPGSNPF